MCSARQELQPINFMHLLYKNPIYVYKSRGVWKQNAENELLWWRERERERGKGKGERERERRVTQSVIDLNDLPAVDLELHLGPFGLGIFSKTVIR